MKLAQLFIKFSCYHFWFVFVDVSAPKGCTRPSALGEQIRVSNESVISNLKQAFNEELKKVSQRLTENFDNTLTELHLLESNLSLVTIMTEFGKGSKDCWKLGFFRDEDIKSGYDARRPITADIVTSIGNNVGTIVYGKPYYGKSIILKRIMFEMIDNGYAIVYGNGIQKAQPRLIIQLLNRITATFLGELETKI